MAETFFLNATLATISLVVEHALDSARKESGSIFAERDFEQILHAREAFSRIHGKQLSPKLSKRLTNRRFSAQDLAHAAPSNVAQVEVEVFSS